MCRFLFEISLMSLVDAAFSQSKHPFTFGDMMKAKRGDPEASPALKGGPRSNPSGSLEHAAARAET